MHFILTCTTLHLTLHYTCFSWWKQRCSWSGLLLLHFSNVLRYSLSPHILHFLILPSNFSWQATFGQKCIWSALLLLHFSNVLQYSWSGKVVWKRCKWSTHYLRCNWSPDEAHLKYKEGVKEVLTSWSVVEDEGKPTVSAALQLHLLTTWESKNRLRVHV